MPLPVHGPLDVEGRQHPEAKGRRGQSTEPVDRVFRVSRTVSSSISIERMGAMGKGAHPEKHFPRLVGREASACEVSPGPTGG